MNYKEIVDNLNELMANHQMISDTGYGQLSDIKVLDESGDGVNYPYAFLVPGQHQRQDQMMMYNFNLIMMEMAINDGEVLKVQSDMMQIIDDLLGAIKHTIYGNLDVDLNVSVNVFRERFQDEVAGATAQITFELPLPMRGGGSGSGGDPACDPTPFDPTAPIVLCPQTLEQWSNNVIEAPAYYLGANDMFKHLRWETNTQTDANIGLFNDIILVAYAAGEFEFRVEQEISFDEPEAGETLALEPKLIAGGVTYNPVCDSSNWPTEWTSLDPIIWTAVYRAPLLIDQNAVIQLVPTAGITQSSIVQLGSSGQQGGTLQIGYQA